MSAISLKSISGITSITTPAGVDNQFTLHNNNTTEAVKLDTAGNFHFHNHLNITGVSTASNFKTGTSNLHNTGLNVQDLDVDGHTNLDNVSIAGVTTSTGNIYADNYYANSSLTLNNNGNPAVIITSTSTTGSSRIFFGDPDSALVGRITYEHNGDYMPFYTAYGERLRITSDGKIGINETSPAHRLVVGGDGYFGFNTPTDAARQVIFNVNRGSAGQTLANINWQWNSKNVAQVRGVAGADTTNKDDGHLAFFTSAANSLVERLRITSNGNVGIGIVDPDQQLEVNGIIKVGSYFQGGASGTATNNWHFGAEGNGEFRFYTGNYGAGNLKQTINNNGDVLPGVHNTSDLGSSSKRWRNVYTTDLQLSNEGKTNDVDGTWGNYTIQEGESELFLINNRNGKKYVFLLKEVL